MQIAVISVHSPQPSHFDLIKSLCKESFVITKHEPLNEQMLLSLEQKVYGIPKHMLQPGEIFRRDKDLNLGIAFSCAYFGIIGQEYSDTNPPADLSGLLSALGHRGENGFLKPDKGVLSYLQLSYGYGQWYMAVILPEPSPKVRQLAKRLVEEGIGHIKSRGGGQVQLFSPMSSELIGEVAEEAGFEESFTLLSVKKELSAYFPQEPPPSQESTKKDAEAVSVRGFRVGQDEQTWLELNRRAFAVHKEQGKWSLGDFLYRENLPWFDPDGLLILEIANKPAGFCWTKIVQDRPLGPGNTGEIYILGLDSQYRGRGLGKALLIAGIRHLRDAKTTVCSLYTDSANVTAIRLYDSLGFVLDHSDKIYKSDIRN